LIVARLTAVVSGLAGLLACTAGAAAAADLGQPAEPFAPPAATVNTLVGWSPFVGVYAEGLLSHPDVNFIGGVDANLRSDYDMTGFRGGLTLGADYRFASGGFIGVDITGGFGSVSGELSGVLDGEINTEIAARVRVGFMMDPSVMVYLHGGVVAAQFQQKLTRGAVRQTRDKTILGGQIGAGGEFMVTSNVGVFTEYALSYFDDENFAYATEQVKVNPTTHALRLGLRYRF
jgi:opacity protein-like surface antigen